MIRWCSMMYRVTNSEWGVISPQHLSYLLVLRVLRSEVTAHNLELHVEMGQSVKQIHPPWWRIIHYGRHPYPAACWLSLLSQTRILTRTLLRNLWPVWVKNMVGGASCTFLTTCDDRRARKQVVSILPNISRKMKVEHPFFLLILFTTKKLKSVSTKWNNYCCVTSM